MESVKHSNPYLRIQFGNAKLSKLVGQVSTPSGFTCPGAKLCLTFTNRKTRKVKRGKDGEVYCYAAMMEAYSPAYQAIAWYNFELFQPVYDDVEGMLELYQESIDMAPNLLIFRSGVSGDVKTPQQAEALYRLAQSRPKVLFYAYTKSVTFFDQWLNKEGEVLPNFMVTCSLGGKYDDLVLERGYKYARIVKDKAEADALGLELDHDDTHAMQPGKSFAQLVHGVQPKGSEWGKYARANGYNKDKKDPLLDVKTYAVYKSFLKRTTPAPTDTRVNS